jgi:hypothetical protein
VILASTGRSPRPLAVPSALSACAVTCRRDEVSPRDEPDQLHPRPPSPSGRAGAVHGRRLAGVGLRGVYTPRGRPSGLGARFDVPRLRASRLCSSRLLRSTLGPALWLTLWLALWLTLWLPGLGTRLGLGTGLGTVVFRPQHLRLRPARCGRRRVALTDRYQIRRCVAVAPGVRRPVAVGRPPAIVHQRHGSRDPHRCAVVVLQLLAEDHLRIGRTATNCGGAVRRRGLPGGGDAVYPDPAHSRRRTMIGRDIPGIGGVPPTLGARVLGRQRDGRSEHKDKQQANHRSSSTSGMAAPFQVHARCH